MTPHGTRNRYVHHHCRCTECTDANNRYQQERKQRRRPYDIDYGLPTAPDVPTGWMDNAACKGHTNLYFPTPGTGHSNHTFHKQARQICDTCPVTTECRNYAIAIDARHGMWAGQTANELKAS